MLGHSQILNNFQVIRKPKQKTDFFNRSFAVISNLSVNCNEILQNKDKKLKI